MESPPGLSVHAWETKTPRGKGIGTSCPGRSWPEKRTQPGTKRWAQASPSAGLSGGPTGGAHSQAAPGIWPDAQAEVSRRGCSWALVVFFPCLCHAPIYMTPGPLSSEHTSEKGKSGSGSHHPSEVSKDFPFPSPSL